MRFSDIHGFDEIGFKKIMWRKAEGLNSQGSRARANAWYSTLYEMSRRFWNDVKNSNNPYRYFEGALVPDGVDEDGNIIYKYNPDVSL